MVRNNYCRHEQLTTFGWLRSRRTLFGKTFPIDPRRVRSVHYVGFSFTQGNLRKAAIALAPPTQPMRAHHSSVHDAKSWLGSTAAVCSASTRHEESSA